MVLILQSNRLDLCCCVQLDKTKKGGGGSEGVLFKIFKNFYSEALLSRVVRPVVVGTPVYLPFLIPGRSLSDAFGQILNLSIYCCKRFTIQNLLVDTN